MLVTVIKKEAKQLFNDKIILLIALLQPIVFIVVFGSSFSGGDISGLKTMVIDYDNTKYSNFVLEGVENSSFFKLVDSKGLTLEEGLNALNRSEVRALVFVPKGFGDDINLSQTTNISFYLDSSDFMIYKTLSAAKGDILKNVLIKISDDIFSEIEEQKDSGKKRIEEIKTIFDQIKIEANKIKDDVDDTQNSPDMTKVIDLSNDLKSSLDDQIDSANSAQTDVDNLIALVQTIQTTEVQKIAVVVGGLNQIKDGYSQAETELVGLRLDLDEINFQNLDNGLVDKMQGRIDNIKDLFDEADKKSKSIDIDLDKIHKGFLTEPLKIHETLFFGDLTYFDYLGAGVLSLIVFFVGLMISSINIISEKEKNTLYRVSTTPVHGMTIFLGKFSLFIVFGLLEMIYTFALAIFMYDLRVSGSLIGAASILFLLNCSAISIGLLISSKVKTMQQGLIVVPLIVIPMFLISQAFFPPDMFPAFMNYISYISPMTFSNMALRTIMIKGFSIYEVLPSIIALALFTIIPLVMFVLSYRRIKY